MKETNNRKSNNRSTCDGKSKKERCLESEGSAIKERGCGVRKREREREKRSESKKEKEHCFKYT